MGKTEKGAIWLDRDKISAYDFYHCVEVQHRQQYFPIGRHHHIAKCNHIHGFQKAGHKVLLLMGGATASVGDPSGKTELRKMLSKEELNYNIEKIKKVATTILQSATIFTV